ncbi:uncharacterized protein M6B38_360005 [Iris pallida]|uniref:EamA domain-containing protein n=1 Tax=Iris pallida TaxID=29817 RepID=A0AAX6GKP1_IRIPA|nr:uncharacterized protein M6B38_360005 [Iris pallida]
MEMAPVDAGGDGGGGGGGSAVVEVNVSACDDEISPLLAEVPTKKPPRMTIFSVSNPHRRSLKEPLSGTGEPEVSFLYQIILWAWSGSRYSGLLCMASSSTIYTIMEFLMLVFPVHSVPLFEILCIRCTIILVLSFIWLRKIGQPLFVPTHTRNLLILRSLTGFISLLSFIYSVQNLPLSLAVTLNFATPIMASIGAKIILQEKLSLASFGGLACSFLGLWLIFQPMLVTRGDSSVAGDKSTSGSARESHPIFAILVGIFSSTLGGISYCLIRAGSKASDHPVYTVLSFVLLASPISAICTFTLQKFVVPSVFTLISIILLAVLAFFAEVSLARGLQLEKVSKVTNILYIKVVLSQVWSMAFLGVAASFSKVVGCLIILASVCTTVYLGPEKEIE